MKNENMLKMLFAASWDKYHEEKEANEVKQAAPEKQATNEQEKVLVFF
ncbi:hypothetical protein [Priestia megaterium]|nr:hypothetical protein [Priestia megaterium]